MKRQIRFLLAPALALALVAIVLFTPQAAPQANSAAPGNNVLARAVAIETGQAKLRPGEQRVSSGTLYAALQGSGEIDRRMNSAPAQPNLPSLPSINNTQGCQNVFTGNGMTNTRVNQDCSFRRQAEEVVVVNPTNPKNLIAGQNDSRVGFNHCGYDWSFDGGKTWGDQIPPFYQFILADGHTADACSDPTATFDAKGNAYAGGILFDINSAASAFIVMKSNAGIGGAFYHTPKAGPFQLYSDTPAGVIANDNDPNIAHDKEFIMADASPRSPKVNNVYATWTRFNGATGAGVTFNSPIMFSQSTDGGATWSPGVEISGANAAICTVFSAETNAAACDQDQGSDPIVGPEGGIYVSFNNGNTPNPGIQQQLVVYCAPTLDCSKQASWTSPVKIATDYATQPFGPDANACAPGRQCIPPNGYRIDDYGAISIDSTGKLYFVWSDYRNGDGTCPPLSNTATDTPPCNNDVFYSYSTDNGKTWSDPINVTPSSKFGQSAQWQAWGQVAPNGTFWVGYYDRSYGNCETTGCNDITLARVNNAASKTPSFSYTRVTTASMPNLTPANNPVEAGFLGDYMWVTVDGTGKPYLVWGDTRGLNGAVEEDIYFATVPQ